MHLPGLLSVFALTASVIPTVLAAPSPSFGSHHVVEGGEHHDSGHSSHRGNHHNSDSNTHDSSSHHRTGSKEQHHTGSKTSSHHSGHSSSGGTTGLGHHKATHEEPVFHCVSELDDLHAARQEHRFKKAKVASKAAKAGPVLIDVYWHIVAANETVEGGYVTRETIDEQMRILNDAYDLAEIDYQVLDVDYKITDAFDRPFRTLATNFTPSADEVADRTERRKGTAATLNIWTSQLADGLGGIAAFPFQYESDPAMDGILVDWRTLPGGKSLIDSSGYVVIHEIGHWVGLYHTFQGGEGACSGPGDYVSDTPSQIGPSKVCGNPAAAFCAPVLGGDVSYSNYMDYAFGNCERDFTVGQIRRARDEIRTYRGIEAA